MPALGVSTGVAIFPGSGRPAGSVGSVPSCRPLCVGPAPSADTVGSQTRSCRWLLLVLPVVATDWGWAGRWHSGHTVLFFPQRCWGFASSRDIGNKEIQLPFKMIPSTGIVARGPRRRRTTENLFNPLIRVTGRLATGAATLPYEHNRQSWSAYSFWRWSQSVVCWNQVVCGGIRLSGRCPPDALFDSSRTVTVISANRVPFSFRDRGWQSEYRTVVCLPVGAYPRRYFLWCWS